MSFRILRHAVAEAYLAEARDARTSSARFRELVRRLGGFVASEALREAPTRPVDVVTPCGLAQCRTLADSVLIVPILRAGLTYAEGVSQILPEAAFGHIGLYRDEVTKRPVTYFCKVPKCLSVCRILLVDPMLATGHSAVAAAEALLARGAVPDKMALLTLVAAPEGRDVFLAAHPDIDVWTVALDEGLNENAYIVPGLGDAGDRLFGTLN